MNRTAAGVLAVTISVSCAAAAVAPRPAQACRVLELSFTPGEDLQIVVWVEDSAGNYVDTLFMTRKTATYGLGNRPGIMEFNSEFLWPYGRRVTVFPVWAARHAAGVHMYPHLIFQDEDDLDLSHSIAQSSLEPYFCRPLRVGEDSWNASVDAGTCATPTYTDKGKFLRYDDGGVALISPYPPRNDLAEPVVDIDHEDVAMFDQINDLDGISQATPPAATPYTIRWSVPTCEARCADFTPPVPDGDYVAWIEVSSEFDQNEFYDFPSPTGIPWSEYGQAYRGQPSVVWAVPFTISQEDQVAQVSDYYGYGDPDGFDGLVSPPDLTISSDVEGSGARRLLLAEAPEGSYRFRVASHPREDDIPPGAPAGLDVVDVQSDRVTASFVEPADDGLEGARVAGYEVRWLAGTPIDEANFLQGEPLSSPIQPSAAGATVTFSLPAGEVRPETRYYIAVRAHDGCLNQSPLSVIEVVTPRAEGGEVAACFVATAAYQSPLAADVAMLRGFRDEVLRHFIIGELFVESYYTVGPALAEVIRPAEPLRGITRAALRPFVELARSATVAR
jgi:hypothetical protein